MKIIKTVKKMQEFSLKNIEKGRKIGFVPTMGALHEGHLSLIRKACRENDFVVVSIFVNPLQFNNKNDLKKYPRNFEKDKKLLEKEKVSAVFSPSVKEMYPSGFRKTISAGRLGRIVEGRARKGHFDGVAAVCKKLFDAVLPANTYFGEKDFQQLQVVRQMVIDLKLPLKIVGYKIVRDKNGLALSSRNKYLSRAEYEKALSLNKALRLGRELFRKGERSSGKIVNEMTKLIRKEKGVKIDYLKIVDSKSFKKMKSAEKNSRIVLAVFVGKTRLIDNAAV